jgi:hypothetical protein
MFVELGALCLEQIVPVRWFVVDRFINPLNGMLLLLLRHTRHEANWSGLCR